MQSTNSATSADRAKVLIVDDNLQNLELLEAYMDELPEVEALTATNGVDALEKVAAHRPAVVLLDIMMPRMSGFEVCRHIKADPKTRDISVVMVTALDELGDEERARECGADRFLSKPVNRGELVGLVRDLIRLHRG